MTASKDFKKLVRARMETTGENYTTARKIVLSQPISRKIEPCFRQDDHRICKCIDPDCAYLQRTASS